MPFYVLLGLSAFLISLLGTRLLIITLRRKSLLLDMPKLRGNHKTPTPRGGGIAVTFAIIICMSIADIHFAIILSALLLAAISLLDDLIQVPSGVRLLVQIMAVAIALITIDTPLFGGILPIWLERCILGLLWIWFTNAFNFMDGIDGISAAEMMAIGGGAALVVVMMGAFPSSLSLYGIIIAAAGCGFIWWNWQPAKIFLGDVGSIPIGFLLGYLLLLTSLNGHIYAALILPAYYIADSSITLFQRISRGERIWVAHSEHYYQKAVRSGRSHGAVVRYITCLNIILVCLAIYAELLPELAPFILCAAYLAVTMLLKFFAHTKHNPQQELF
ncbi:MAG: glycosyltransferase family 4 protein [Rickettsiales bacterium]|nr:glycosyltransferase family 4 protein [Rickettsiales bacterium]